MLRRREATVVLFHNNGRARIRSPSLPPLPYGPVSCLLHHMLASCSVQSEKCNGAGRAHWTGRLQSRG